MWGSTFSEIAKKAQHLQEQASHLTTEASTTWTSTGAAGLFNLDAMQQEAAASGATMAEEPSVTSHISKNASGDMPAIIGSPSPREHTATVGALRVPSSPVVVEKTETEVIAPEDNQSTSMENSGKVASATKVSVQEEDESVHEQDGWGDDDLEFADLQDPEEPAPAPNEEQAKSGASHSPQCLAVDKSQAVSVAKEASDLDSVEEPADKEVSFPSETIDDVSSEKKIAVSKSEVDEENEASVSDVGEESLMVVDSTRVETTADNPAALKPSVEEQRQPIRESLVEDDLPAIDQVGDAARDEIHDDSATEDVPRMDSAERTDSLAPDATSAATNAAEPPDASLQPPMTTTSNKVDVSLLSDELMQLRAAFAAEKEEMEQIHRAELEDLRASFSHQACLAEQKKMEAHMMQAINAKEAQMNELMRVNEGYKLKMDVLKREVEGTQKLLHKKDSSLGRASQSHSAALNDLQEKLSKSEKKAEKFKFELSRAKETIDRTKEELAASRQEHDDLRERVKGVATELKVRRGDVRSLQAKLEEAGEKNNALLAEIGEMQDQLGHRERSQGERHEEVKQLQSNIVSLEVKLEAVEQKLAEEKATGEETLADYKKKAQNSLAAINSRIASSMQAKEEAELEARAARAAADTAMDRAVQAEADSKRQVAEARAAVASMEKERDAMTEMLSSLNSDASALQAELDHAKAGHATVSESLKETTRELHEEMQRRSEAEEKVISLESSNLTLHAKVERLTGETSALRENIRDVEHELAEATKTSVEDPEVAEQRNQDKKQAEEEIRLLREEIRSANKAIEDLKDALQNAVAAKSASDASASTSPVQSGHMSAPTNGNGSSMPLFYAMEKQAELQTARDEINRLANMLSNAQAERSEAIDAQDAMRRKVEKLNSKLARYEKLVPQTALGDSSERGGDDGLIAAADPGATNVEYLKNVMMSYLNTRTLAERKALIPVIGAVLCLTSDEQREAMHNLDQSASVVGVGSSIFESFTSRYT